jgi:hypothetical protein
VPNHITNNVTITGTPEDIRLFREMAFIEPGEAWPDDPNEVNTKNIPLLNFGLVVPEPPNIERGGCSGQHEEGVICWYTWHLENWGTKWGAYEHTHFEQRWFEKYAAGEAPREIYGRIDLRFETAWSQPTPVFERIEQRWKVEVHCVSQDEGGFPDTIYGDPYDHEYIRKVVAFEFDAYEREVAEPVEEDAQ